MPLTKLEAIIGGAGSGKTTLIRQRMKEAKEKGIRNYATLTATTGIAAINLSGGQEGVSTINSELGYFDTASLRTAYANQKLHRKLKELATKCRTLIVDEMSMFEKTQFNYIIKAADDINELGWVSDRGGLGITLVGDFLQLPPIGETKPDGTKLPGEFCFTSEYWERVKILKLEKIWRQDNVEFLEMLYAARSGDGDKVAEAIYDIQGITVNNELNRGFEGTTIVAVNKEVDTLNDTHLEEMLQNKQNTKFEFQSYRWGRQRSDWKKIPDMLVVCKNAYVMILSNDYPDFTYANGSCGYIKDANIDTKNVTIELKENKRIVTIRKVTRKNFTEEKPFECEEPPEAKSRKDFMDEEGEGMSAKEVGINYKSYLLQLTAQYKKPNLPYFDFTEGKWVVGEVSYLPIRLAYATTTHKSQGLTLDQVQINFAHQFFGSPSMAYVALSRVRTPEGLTVVGNKNIFRDRTNVSEEVVPWI